MSALIKSPFAVYSVSMLTLWLVLLPYQDAWAARGDMVDMTCGLFRFTKYALAGFLLIGAGVVFLILFIIAYCCCCKRSSGTDTAPQKNEDGELTIICTRIYGESILWRQCPSEMKAAVETQTKIIRSLITKYKFYEVSYYDGRFVVAADDAFAAAQMAVETQALLLQQDWQTSVFDETYKAAEDGELLLSGAPPPTAKLPAPKYSALWNGLRVCIGISTGPVYARRTYGDSFFFMGAATSNAEALAEVARNGQVLMDERSYNITSKLAFAAEKPLIALPFNISKKDKKKDGEDPEGKKPEEGTKEENPDLVKENTGDIIRKLLRLCTAELYNNADPVPIYQICAIDGRTYGGMRMFTETAEEAFRKLKAKRGNLDEKKKKKKKKSIDGDESKSDSEQSSDEEGSEHSPIKKKEKKKKEKEKKKKKKEASKEEGTPSPTKKEESSSSSSDSDSSSSSSGSEDHLSQYYIMGKPKKGATRPRSRSRHLSKADTHSSLHSRKKSVDDYKDWWKDANSSRRSSRSSRSSSPKKRRRSSRTRGSRDPKNKATDERGDGSTKDDPLSTWMSGPQEDELFQLSRRRPPNLYAVDLERSQKLSVMASLAGAASPPSGTTNNSGSTFARPSSLKSRSVFSQPSSVMKPKPLGL